jgi:hypothetical protein
MPGSMLRCVDEPTKDDVACGPAHITLLDGSGFLTVGRIRRVDGPENLVMKEHAVESLVSLAQALDTPDAIILVQVQLGVRRAAEAVVGAGDREPGTAVGPLGSGGVSASASAAASLSMRCSESPLR